jgi:hypothetical protein
MRMSVCLRLKKCNMDPDEETPEVHAPSEEEDLLHTDIECDPPPPPLKWTKRPWAWREAVQDKTISAKRIKLHKAVANTKSSKCGKC